MNSATALHIDPDIRSARTLPAWVYRDRDVFDRAGDRVFARSWQIIADREDVRLPQTAHPCTFLDPLIDEPLLITRDDDDRLRCLSNVCTHRGAVVINAPCKAAHLRCPYHGRRFALDGTFQSMPEFEQTADFPSERDNLVSLNLREWGPFALAALDPAAPFDDVFGEMMNLLEWYPFDHCRFDPNRSRDYLVQANWALYCDNYLEGFHIPFVHSGLAAVINYDEYRTELFPWSNVQIGVSRGSESLLDIPADSPHAGQQIAAYYFWVFPNLMFNVYPWGLSVNIVRPIAPDRTKISFRTYVHDESTLDQGAGAELDRVEREDEVIVESVQRGIHSRVYDRGRYSPTREQGVHHFHRLLTQTLDGA